MRLFNYENKKNEINISKKKNEHPIYEFVGMKSKRILVLNLTKEAFEITGTKEKKFELRKKCNWIESRLFVKSNDSNILYEKKYDYILFIEGYGHNRPFKLMRHISTEKINKSKTYKFSNGLEFTVRKGDFKINIGDLTITKNICEI